MLNKLDSATERFLTDMSDVSRRLERAQREVTSGRRVNTVSDDPDVVSNLLQIRVEINKTDQTLTNLGRVQTDVDAGEQSLQSAVSVLERARVLGQQGANGTQTPEQRAAIGVEVGTLIEQMVGLSRTTVEARFIFSGDSDGVEPFTLDLSQDDPFSPYQGGAVTREIEHPSGSRFQVARTGEEIFDNPDLSKNVLDAMNNLRLALRDNDQAGIEASLTQIQSADTHLNSELAAYGAAQNQVAEAVDFGHKQQLRLEARRSSLEDADVTESIISFNQAKYQQDVALSTKAKIPRTSLFDYLG